MFWDDRGGWFLIVRLPPRRLQDLGTGGGGGEEEGVWGLVRRLRKRQGRRGGSVSARQKVDEAFPLVLCSRRWNEALAEADEVYCNAFPSWEGSICSFGYRWCTDPGVQFIGVLG